MKHVNALPAALSMAQPVRLVASQVVLDVLPVNQTRFATDQSSEMSPQGCFGMKKPSLLG
jgi:hypothetical protein